MRWATTICMVFGLAVTSVQAEPGRIRIGPGQMAIRVEADAGAVGRRAAELFAQEVRERSGVEVALGSMSEDPAFAMVIRKSSDEGPAAAGGTQPVSDVGKNDHFHLTIRTSKPQVELASPTPSGIMAGMGHLMRICRYASGQLSLPLSEVRQAPAMPVRGIYFATHFGNFYDAAPLREVDRIIESMALWGTNQLVVWFDMHHFKSFEDPRAQAHLARLKHMAGTAHALGMQFGLVFLGNEGYAESPPALRAKYKEFWPHYHVEICPATPEGMALIAREQERVLRAFERVEVCWSWPYDQGGCACDACMPWGGNGFLRVSRQLGQLYQKIHPGGQFWVSTWLFDAYGANGKLAHEDLAGTGDYQGFLRCLADEKPDWLAGIIMGTHGSWLPKPLLSRPSPERYPLAGFPEISMRLMNPWGGFGANPMPGYCEQLAAGLRGKIVGGWPYSEGIYEDFNRFYLARFFWNATENADDAAQEYAEYYFGQEAGGEGARLLKLLERTQPRDGWTVANLAEADEAFSICQSVESKMPAWASRGWRWRIVRLRCEIDHTLRHDGLKADEGRTALKRCTDELRRIYHAERADSWVRPPEP